MPLYDYKCGACDHAFEVNHAMSAPPVKKCPECGKEEVRKVLTTGGVSIGGGSSGAPPMPPCAGGGCAGGMCGM